MGGKFPVGHTADRNKIFKALKGCKNRLQSIQLIWTESSLGDWSKKCACCRAIADGITLRGVQHGGGRLMSSGVSTTLTRVMATADCDIELEDGEIYDLEDGEIDEEILLSTESSSNVFSRLEPRQHEDLLRDQQDNTDNINSHGLNNRDFAFYRSSPVDDRWELQGGPLSSASRERFPRGRESLVNVRGRSKVFRGSGREMTGRDKSCLIKRGGQRRRILYFTLICFKEETKLVFFEFFLPQCSKFAAPSERRESC